MLLVTHRACCVENVVRFGATHLLTHMVLDEEGTSGSLLAARASRSRFKSGWNRYGFDEEGPSTSLLTSWLYVPGSSPVIAAACRLQRYWCLWDRLSQLSVKEV